MDLPLALIMTASAVCLEHYVCRKSSDEKPDRSRQRFYGGAKCRMDRPLDLLNARRSTRPVLSDVIR